MTKQNNVYDLILEKEKNQDTQSLKVNFIYGNGKSVCNNDAYSVVQTVNGKEKDVIDIIPLYEIPGKTSEDLIQAFSEAQNQVSTKDNKEIVQYARTLLKQSAKLG